MRIVISTLIAALALSAGGSSSTAQPAGPGLQVAGALSAAPEDRRENATVMGYSPAGELVTLRQGANEMICLADKPGDERFHAACYFKALEPFMARGRELRAQGVEHVAQGVFGAKMHVSLVNEGPVTLILESS